MDFIPECYYRISVKGLILNETRDKFLICKKENGRWELPGGGLDWGMSPQEDLPREIMEEMGIKVLSVAKNPSYFLTAQTLRSKQWVANVVYEATLEHLNYTPSNECIEVRFVNKEDITAVEVFPTVAALAEQFRSENHR